MDQIACDSIIFDNSRLKMLEFWTRLEMTKSKGLRVELWGRSQTARGHEEWMRRKGTGACACEQGPQATLTLLPSKAVLTSTTAAKLKFY